MAIVVHGDLFEVSSSMNKASVASSATAYSTVGASEIGIAIGTSVAKHKRAAITHELLRKISLLKVKRPSALPAGGQVGRFALTLSGASEPRAEAFTYSVISAGTTIDENQIAIVVGTTAAAKLDRSLLFYEGVRNCLDRFWRDVQRKA